jgi:(3,5-dihydroxyphenyl)acetyl-CoA 1,2-dioxygenase
MISTAGLPPAVTAWSATVPATTGDNQRDCAAFSAFWTAGNRLLDALPPKPERSAAEQALAAAILETARKSRKAFLRAHATALYGRLTNGRTQSHRVEHLAYAAAAEVPGLCPTSATVDRELTLLQKDKDGHEIDQGLLFNAFLGDAACGTHLCHAMLLPSADALARLDAYRRDGRIDLGTAALERRGTVSIVWFKNGRYLNAEDETTLQAVETAVDLAILDPETKVGVLRGAPVETGKYAGMPVFSTGINLTHLYNGKVGFLWYLIRDLGFINKMFRGQSLPDEPADEIHGETHEKPWLAAVEKFAIGGGCQYLLATDYVIAARDAYMTLPARKEGIIPGVANLRLPRFTGDRIARQAIMSERRIDCDTPVGRMICDEIVDASQIDQAIMDVAERLSSSGVVSAASNRRSFRIGHETLDQFRQYMAVYSREQAYCHFSTALISNLERYWNAQNRKM